MKIFKLIPFVLCFAGSIFAQTDAASATKAPPNAASATNQNAITPSTDAAATHPAVTTINGAPGGSGGQVQYNSAGLFGGASSLTFDPATGITNMGNVGPEELKVLATFGGDYSGTFPNEPNQAGNPVGIALQRQGAVVSNVDRTDNWFFGYNPGQRAGVPSYGWGHETNYDTTYFSCGGPQTEVYLYHQIGNGNNSFSSYRLLQWNIALPSSFAGAPANYTFAGGGTNYKTGASMGLLFPGNVGLIQQVNNWIVAATDGEDYPSSSSNTIGTGSKTFTVGAGLKIAVGDYLRAYNGGNKMSGYVTAYSGTSLTINVDAITGLGTFASWTLSRAALGGMYLDILGGRYRFTGSVMADQIEMPNGEIVVRQNVTGSSPTQSTFRFQNSATGNTSGSGVSLGLNGSVFEFNEAANSITDYRFLIQNTERLRVGASEIMATTGSFHVIAPLISGHRSIKFGYGTAASSTTSWQIGYEGYFDNKYLCFGNGYAGGGMQLSWNNNLLVGNNVAGSGGEIPGSGGLKVFGNTDATSSTTGALQSAGGLGVAKAIVAGTTMKTGTYIVSALPSAATAGAGARAFVTDALSPAFGATVVGGGAVAVPVYSDGTNWKVG